MQMLGNHGNMTCRHTEEWLGHIVMMMKRGEDKRFLSQLACFIDCIHFCEVSDNEVDIAAKCYRSMRKKMNNHIK